MAELHLNPCVLGGADDAPEPGWGATGDSQASIEGSGETRDVCPHDLYGRRHPSAPAPERSGPGPRQEVPVFLISLASALCTNGDPMGFSGSARDAMTLHVPARVALWEVLLPPRRPRRDLRASFNVGSPESLSTGLSTWRGVPGAATKSGRPTYLLQPGPGHVLVSEKRADGHRS